MICTLSEFLQHFSPTHLHVHREFMYPYVFWSEYGGSENNSFSADLGSPEIHDKIKSALSDLSEYRVFFFAQFWVPVTIGGRRLLSTSGQPFAVGYLFHELAKYRVYSEKYKYSIDVNQFENGRGDHMIISGGPAFAFLNRLPYINQLHWIPSKKDYDIKLKLSIMLPICLSSQSSSCIGVLEVTLEHPNTRLLLGSVRALKKVGLDVFPIQDLIPYEIQLAKDEIQEALKVVCESHNLALAQVWIPYEDKSFVPFSYSLEDTQTKQLLAIKLTGYLNDEDVGKNCFYNFKTCFKLGDLALTAGGQLPLVTLQDHKSRYISELGFDMLIYWARTSPTSALAICLRSNDTNDFNYVFEFLWIKHSDIVIHLEALLLTLKKCLPKFKFASGAELGDELNVHNKDDEIKFKIFKGKRSMVVDDIQPSKVTCKTTPKVLPLKDIEKQFGKTMKDAAKDLNVSLSTLKRKIKDFGISEWPGPNFMKRNKINDSSINQINANEEDNGAIEDTLIANLNKKDLTIKAEYAGDMIKFDLPFLQATFVTVENKIREMLKLSNVTYKLKYRDEDGDWICLTSDEEMCYCMKTLRKSDRNVVRMRVIPSL